ncbi:MAG TPA: succinate dehydrogenase cytochrome b subunit [Flavobacteriales bacterium]|nr:succinate dehydrogenase cytochrome b subunit [Flavobacteriales bacterium]
MGTTGVFRNSIGRKLLMGLTGIFLISFLVIHCFINSLIFFNDGGETFNMGAAFMANNWIIRAMEIVLFLGIFAHIFLALQLTMQNRRARPVKYAVGPGNKNAKWYSRWMGLLGTLILMFLIVHIRHFWVETRVMGLEHFEEQGMSHVDVNGLENLYGVMQIVFSELWVVILYCLAMVSLAYHLLHGFQSSFQTLGLNHKKYTPIIKSVGAGFSIIVPLIFAAMPVSMYMGWIK